MAIRNHIKVLIDAAVADGQFSDVKGTASVQYPENPNADEIAYLQTQIAASRVANPDDMQVTIENATLNVDLDAAGGDNVEVLQTDHDDLNTNANLQVGNADASVGNPVPVVLGGGGAVEVTQATHDDLNGNMTLQVADVDVGVANPVPVELAGGGALDVTQAVHDDLNANANLQIADVDVSPANPVDTEDAPLAALVTAGNVDLAAIEVINTAIQVATEKIDNMIEAEGTAFAGELGVVGGVVESTVPTELTDGDAAAFWLRTFKELVIAGYNLSMNAVDTNEVSPAKMAYAIQDLGSLAAPAEATNPVNSTIYDLITFQLVVSGMVSDVVVRAQGSLEGTNWYNLDDGNLDNTITANGVYKMDTGPHKSKYVRLLFVSESDAGPVVAVKIMLGN